MGLQLRPGVMDGDHFRQRADRELPRFAVQHARRPLRRGKQGEPILGQRRRWPELSPGVHGGGPASIPQPQDSRPIAS